MKSFLRKYRHLTSLVAVIMAAFALVMLGAPLALGVFIVGLYQLSQFAMSKRTRFCCVAGLTPEQLREFDAAMREVSENVAEWKLLPGRMRELERRNDEMAGELKKYRRLQAAGGIGGTGVRWIGNIPYVSDDAAEAITATVVLGCSSEKEVFSGVFPDSSKRERLLAKSKAVLGVTQRAGGSLTPTDIPLPTIYVPQIIELVFAYGQARQHATVFPLGSGTVKLPRLKAGEDTFSYLGVGTAGISQPVSKKEVTAELVTFTANKLGGLVVIPSELEEDTFVPIGQFLARYIARQFAKMEDLTLFLGDGTGTYANMLGVGPYCVATPTYLNVLGAGKTKPSDATLQDFRNLRPKVNPAVIANMAANGQVQAAYYMHPTMEALLVTFNTIGSPLIYRPAQAGQPATLDGFPIRWIGVSQAYQTTAAAGSFLAFFGDLTYWYLGERGAPRIEISRDVYFATDELAMRALERIDVEAMAVDAMAALQTAAA